jgi:hypothetical protein
MLLELLKSAAKELLRVEDSAAVDAVETGAVAKVLKEQRAEKSPTHFLEKWFERAEPPTKRSPEELGRIEQLLQTGEIKFGGNRDLRSRGFIRSGYIEDGNRPPIHVLEKKADLQPEVKAYNLHKISPFTNYFPVTVQRSPGVFVQERVGKALDERLKGLSMTVLFEKNKVFRDQLEQTLAQRVIDGNEDSHVGNLTMTGRRGQLALSNIDYLGYNTFSVYEKPQLRDLVQFGRFPLSESTLEKIDTFHTRLGDPSVASILMDEHFDERHLIAMRARSQWLLDEKHLPDGRQ